MALSNPTATSDAKNAAPELPRGQEIVLLKERLRGEAPSRTPAANVRFHAFDNREMVIYRRIR
jgi:hypothetical protein